MTQRTWLITGVNSGFGRLMTEALLERGDRVAGTVRKLDAMNDLKAKYGDRLWLANLDMTDLPAVRSVVNKAFAELGTIDVIVSNAGYGLFGAAEELSDEQVAHQLSTNLFGPIQLIRAALPHLRAQGGGRIIGLSTYGGQAALPGGSLYHASKCGSGRRAGRGRPRRSPRSHRRTRAQQLGARRAVHAARRARPLLRRRGGARGQVGPRLAPRDARRARARRPADADARRRCRPSARPARARRRCDAAPTARSTSTRSASSTRARRRRGRRDRGYDNNSNTLIRNGNDRITLNLFNSMRPLSNLEVSAGMIYTQTNLRNNNPSGISSVTSNLSYAGSPYPYAQLADANGNALAITKTYRDRYKDSLTNTGYLDWQYRPLDEIRLADNTTRTDHLLLRAVIKYRIIRSLDVQVSYQNERQVSNNRNYMDVNTYFVRNLVNQFYNPAGTSDLRKYPVPLGGILDLANNTLRSDNLRAQINFDRRFGNDHELTALGGTELKEIKLDGYGRRAYGYDPVYGTAFNGINYDSSFRTAPSGTQKIPSVSNALTGTTNRFVSWFANAAYTYKKKYTLSVSGRQDGANIFGVNADQRITPLGSAGIGWNISNEPFYHSALIPYAKIRATYGFNGNVYNASAYLTGSYASFGLNGNQALSISAPPNPELKWERVKNINFGIDIRSRKDRVIGSLEYYTKAGLDLIESAPIAASTGFTTFKGNAASNLTKGIDLTLTTKNITGRFQWNTSLLFSYMKDKVTHFDTKYLPTTLANYNPAVSLPAASGLFAVKENRCLVFTATGGKDWIQPTATRKVT